MEEEIEDYIKEYYKNIKLEVKFKEFRKYIIILKFEFEEAHIDFTYDNHFTFDNNMNNLIHFINNCILEYYKR